MMTLPVKQPIRISSVKCAACAEKDAYTAMREEEARAHDEWARVAAGDALSGNREGAMCGESG